MNWQKIERLVPKSQLSNFYESADDVPDPKELSPEQTNLIIFDDLLLQKQNKCEAYYVRGRLSNCDCLYL